MKKILVIAIFAILGNILQIKTFDSTLHQSVLNEIEYIKRPGVELEDKLNVIAKYNLTEELKKLLESKMIGPNASCLGRSLLHHSFKPEFTKLLLNAGANIHSRESGCCIVDDEGCQNKKHYRLTVIESMEIRLKRKYVRFDPWTYPEAKVGLAESIKLIKQSLPKPERKQKSCSIQ